MSLTSNLFQNCSPAEAVGMSLDNVSVVRVLHQPCSDGKRQDRTNLKVSMVDFLLFYEEIS